MQILGVVLILVGYFLRSVIERVNLIGFIFSPDMFIIITGLILISLIVSSKVQSFFSGFIYVFKRKNDKNIEKFYHAFYIAELASFFAGVTGMILGFIFYISVIDDTTAWGPGIALSVSSITLGFTLSKLVFLPVKTRFDIMRNDFPVLDPNNSRVPFLKLCLALLLGYSIILSVLHYFYVYLDKANLIDFYLNNLIHIASVLMIITGYVMFQKKEGIILLFNKNIEHDDNLKALRNRISNSLISISIASGIIVSLNYNMVLLATLGTNFNALDMVSKSLVPVLYGLIPAFFVFLPLKQKASGWKI